MEIATILAELQLKGKAIPIAGGDINQNFRVDTAEESYFLKYHSAFKQDFFAAEIAGLVALKDHVRVPKVIRSGDLVDGAYLLLEWIEPGEGEQSETARALAAVHRQTNALFGFPTDNFIGVLPQVNAQATDWVTYFLTCRLDVQVELAKMYNVWTRVREEKYLRLKENIWYNWRDYPFTPSLLHGDFWSGNTFFTTDGDVVLIDPAVSFGDREMDLAMAELFGGFRDDFLATYQAEFPLTTGWQERLPVYQLYYLLVHLNQFGETYGPMVDRILANY